MALGCKDKKNTHTHTTAVVTEVVSSLLSRPLTTILILDRAGLVTVLSSSLGLAKISYSILKLYHILL